MSREGGTAGADSEMNMDVIMLNDRNVANVSGASSFPSSQFDGNEVPKDIEKNTTAAKSEKGPFPHKFKKVVKKSSKTLRTIFVAVCAALIVIVGFMLYFVVIANIPFEDGDNVAPHEWLISRTLWQARWANNTQSPAPFEPVRIVVIQHTVTPTCWTFITCVQALRNLQSYFLINLHYDIPYNFMMGNDGRVYEGRGWGLVGAHTFTYNRCTLGLGFVGNYHTNTHPTDLQLERTKLILQKGVQEGYLHPDYLIVAARDLQVTDSPGDHLVNALQEFEHFEPTDRFRDLPCEIIYDMIS